MDVTCERCNTAYEFDDALVSERGTTVKCTTCGNQFKVRRAQADGPPERWLVRTVDGRELEFRALRDLQAAIAQVQISREDVLSRGGSRPRRLGSIAELEPFFASVSPSINPHATTLGLGPRPGSKARPSTSGAPNYRPPIQLAESSVALPLPTPPPSTSGDSDSRVSRAFLNSGAAPSLQGPSARPPRPSLAVPSARPSAPIPLTHSGTATFGTPEGMVARGPDPHAHDGAPRRADKEPSQSGLSAMAIPGGIGAIAPRDTRNLRSPPPSRGAALLHRDDWSSGATPSPVREDFPATQVEEAEPDVAAQPSSTEDGAPGLNTPTPPAGRASYAHEEAFGKDQRISRFSASVPSARVSPARWIVGMVAVGMLALAVATVGRRFVVGTHPAAAPVDNTNEQRIAALLSDGEKSLLDGDLESAKEQFDKASALGERNAHVVADLAHLAAIKADTEWLRVRLLPPDDASLALVKRQFEEVAGKAQKAVKLAVEVAPTDPTVLRANIDTLRFADNVEGARRLVTQLAASSAQPESALVLAELDLAESKPDWATVLGRLRSALTAEQNLGRARSALVFALARSGDIASARAELDRLSALPRPHPLLNALRSYLARLDKSIDPNSLPDAPHKAGGAGTPPAGSPPHRGRDPRPPKDKPAEPTSPSPTPPSDDPPSSPTPVDTTDLPGVQAPASPHPSPPSAPPKPAPPPAGVDTSDLPSLK